MESLKRCLYIILSVILIYVLIKFTVTLVIYLIPIILVIYLAIKLKKFVENKLDKKEKFYDRNQDFEITKDIDDFSLENVNIVEYEEIK